jgi:hypothetical protein
MTAIQKLTYSSKRVLKHTLYMTKFTTYSPAKSNLKCPLFFGLNVVDKSDDGVFLYHRNRLIKANVRIGVQVVLAAWIISIIAAPRK